ncbi:MAG TPA: LLM class flavin-dependent oxidoreductase, partial [Gaiellaceae bacterium]|nr:LLM class flavin-dependent oxidoreductase [Gaiellaceae bacterium]
MNGQLEFGVNLNNREPLIAPDYDLNMLLDLSEAVEEHGFDSVWVGDSLFSKPRYEPISLLAAISQRTKHVRVGTACMVTSTRNPLYLALEWATLDVISGGRTILGAGAGNPEEGVRREFEALGLPFGKRSMVFEEGLAVLRQLWTEGRVDFHGTYFDYDDVSFYSGTEMAPLMPVQQPPPMWVVSNPRLTGDAPAEVMERRLEAACRRIVRYGDGWMTCCRAQHPEELVDQLRAIEEY